MEAFPDLDFSKLADMLVYRPDSPLLFNSALFLFLFLGFLGFYQLIHRQKTLRTLYVLLFSLYFYYLSSGWYLGLLLLSSVVDFFAGKWIYRARSQWAKRGFLILSLLTNLGILAYFKYSNFFLEIVSHLQGGNFEARDIFLPVGISFFTFQTMSYTIDVYRRQLLPTRKFLDFAFFVSFFPQLVAGPIVRASQFLPQIRRDIYISREDIGRALLLLMGGLFKKAVISDYIGINFVDRVFENPLLYSGFENLMGVYAYALQIYCDFSGYSDMAIGLALLLGFRLPDNFRLPYRAHNLREFWQRWHISLSTWLRDYLYISLGGNRRGKFRSYLNIMVTMLLGGLWHGAAWKFVFWGFLHGIGLIIGRLWTPFILGLGFGESQAWEKKFYRALGLFLTFQFVCLAWIFFRASSFGMALEMIGNIAQNFHPELALDLFLGYPKVFLLILLGYVLHYLPLSWDRRLERSFSASALPVKALAVAIIIWIVIQTQSADVQPFIYFQF